ncbi:hypothetical protein JW872_00455 [Candidatus Babeliales bacterium]|nr:hypothetical protein [Candidatus Babeliales bacterium]
MHNKLHILLLASFTMTSLNTLAMDGAAQKLKEGGAAVLDAAEAADGSMQINTTGFRTVQIIGTVMLASGIFGQAIKAFEHDTGLKLSSWAPIKHIEALLGSIFIGYIASDLADDGKVNSPISSVQDRDGHITWRSLLGFFTRKALWTIPAYAGWIGVDQAVKRPATNERK